MSLTREDVEQRYEYLYDSIKYRSDLSPVYLRELRDMALQALAPGEQAETKVTDAMALAFHNAISDGAIGQSDVDEIKKGLRAALNSTEQDGRLDPIAGREPLKGDSSAQAAHAGPAPVEPAEATETPETDAASLYASGHCEDGAVVSIDFARKLERERNSFRDNGLSLVKTWTETFNRCAELQARLEAAEQERNEAVRRRDELAQSDWRERAEVAESRLEAAERKCAVLEKQLQREKAHVARMDSVIDDANVAQSCINPVEDLKRAIEHLKQRVEVAESSRAEAVREAYELVEQMIIKERDAHPGYWPVCEGLRLEVIALKEAQS